MSVEDQAVRLYDMDDQLISDNGVIPVPLGYLSPGQPYLQRYKLKNDSECLVVNLEASFTHPDGIVKLASFAPETLQPGEEAIMLLQWMISETPKVYGDGPLGDATFQADWDVWIEG
jgi:hypothetical protein